MTSCKGKFELMLQPMSYASDLDELHKSQQTRDLGLVPTRYSYDDSQGGGATLNHPREGVVTKDSYWNHKMGVQELELRVRVSTGYYLYTNRVNSNPKVRTSLVMYSKCI